MAAQTAEIISWPGDDMTTPHGTEVVAFEANRQASIALARMDAHVIECSGRYTEARESIAAVRDSIVRLHERMDMNFATRQEQFDQMRRDNRMVFIMLLIAVGGWVITIGLHFVK